MDNINTFMGQCKDCKFGIFETDPKTGARLWQGICLENHLTNEKTNRPPYHTIMQHFQCSGGKFEER